MRKQFQISGLAAASAILLCGAGGALADQAPAPAKPPVPSLSDVLMSSGLSVTGYVDAALSDPEGDASRNGITGVVPSGFSLKQAALTVAYQPASGFGALVNFIAGTDVLDLGLPGASGASCTGTCSASALGYDLFQAYGQYTSGTFTVLAGKFATVAGAEVVAPTGNTNVTRSLLFDAEPLALTGVRLTDAINSKVSISLGANNGWAVGNPVDRPAAGDLKTGEFALSLTPIKPLAITADAYWGKDVAPSGWPSGGSRTLADLVATWTVTSKFNVVVNYDWGQQDAAYALGSRLEPDTWQGVALYLNYQLTDKWRVSLRGEEFQDKEGLILAGFNPVVSPVLPVAGAGGTAQEGTLTLGYDPTGHVEIRLEGRMDWYPQPVAAGHQTDEGWLEGYYKF